jgi:acetylglutamate kinase
MTDRSEPWVVKVGGRELVPGPALGALVLAIGRWVRAGRPVVLVHGGGDEVSARASQLGLAIERVDGQRVTSDAVLEVVVEVLAGRVNTRLVNALEGGGVPALGLSGLSGRLLRVVPEGDPPGSLGWVGRPTGVHARWLRSVLAGGFTPVLAPLGTDSHGGVYNVNADRVAGALSAGLSAHLLLLTDVPNVRDAQGKALREIGSRDVARLVDSRAATDGMIPKLTSARDAVVDGARSAWIGRLEDVEDDGPRPGHGTWVRPGKSAAKPAALTAPHRGGT